jgi:hypothetical protein
VNTRKLKYSVLTGPFMRTGIAEFLRDLSYGKGKTQSMRGTDFPAIDAVPAWDGKDAPPPVTDELGIPLPTLGLKNNS